MASKFKRKASWYLHYIENGRQIRRSLGPVTEAQAEAERIAIEERGKSATSHAGPLFAQWAIDYAMWHSNEYPDSYYRTESILRVHLIPFFGNMPIGQISPQQAEMYKQERGKFVSRATVAKEIRTLHACLNKAVEWGKIPRNPIKYVKAPRELNDRPPRWYTAEELDGIYRADPEYGQIWRLLANTGMRRGEALNLQWRDIGEKEIRIISEAGARTKSGKYRIVPILPGAGEALIHLQNNDIYVIPQLAPWSISRAFSRTLNRMNIDGSLHCLRHTYCSHLVANGVPLRVVQMLAGHASIKTTERYAHLAPDNLIKMVPRITF